MNSCNTEEITRRKGIMLMDKFGSYILTLLVTVIFYANNAYQKEAFSKELKGYVSRESFVEWQKFHEAATSAITSQTSAQVHLLIEEVKAADKDRRTVLDRLTNIEADVRLLTSEFRKRNLSTN